MKKIGTRIFITLGLLPLLLVLLPLFLDGTPWPVAVRNYLELNGVKDSGAINLVSSIYLGFRVFDTLGETIVLLTAVGGTIAVFTRSGAILTDGYYNSNISALTDSEKQMLLDDPSFTLAGEKRLSHVLRTHLIEVVTGVLGPVVLLFGFYLMLYGHLSPGGGFQGGVIIASGIIFLALGNRIGHINFLTRALVLERIEACAFLLLVFASVIGTAMGEGFFTNPFNFIPGNPASFIVLLNIIIGLKVGAGIGFLCIALVGREIV